jgi:microcystin degradation protein MlrC
MPTVLLAELNHESNGFSPYTTTRESFRERRELSDEEVATLRDTNTEVGGAFALADEEGVDLVHPLAAAATPGGPVARDAYDHYTDRIVSAAERAAPDGVLLALHGAMLPEGMDDGEGPLVAAVREAVGDVPVVVTLDLHGNLSDRLAETADALVAYETYPHVDMAETGRRGLALLLRAIRGEVSPVTRLVRPPMTPLPNQYTEKGPMAELMATAREAEERGGVLKTNVLPGFIPVDNPTMGWSVPVVTDGDPELATEVATTIAAEAWEHREQFDADVQGAEAGVERAVDLAAEAPADAGPVVLGNIGDNPGGGGTGDGTHLLRALLDRAVENAGLAIMHDPDAVERCVEAGVRETLTLSLGGTRHETSGDPVEVEADVRAVTDGRFVNTGPMATGTRTDFGRTAVVAFGPEDTVVLVTERRHQPLDAELWRHAGHPPERFDVLAVKSANHFRAAYEPLAHEILGVNTPGLASIDPHHFEYTNLRRPIFPLDDLDDDAFP